MNDFEYTQIFQLLRALLDLRVILTDVGCYSQTCCCCFLKSFKILNMYQASECKH